PRGWRFPSDETISIARLAVETCVWPLYEVVNGQYVLTAESARIAAGKAEKKPVTDWINSQGRFKHLQQERWAPIVESIQAEVDSRCDRLVKLSEF
ncbi:MAG: pyruvate ferredoxin oxidoreductase, partial [Candidatus Methanomethylophilaceae archaeon]|nr:pyruvate ferredoxin oxidoreductase [Candidatus Methanomethylophilaceae archaeon]